MAFVKRTAKMQQGRKKASCQIIRVFFLIQTQAAFEQAAQLTASFGGGFLVVAGELRVVIPRIRILCCQVKKIEENNHHNSCAC